MIVAATREIARGVSAPGRAGGAAPVGAPSDEALAAAAARGDRAGFDELIDRHAGRLLRYVQARLGNRHDAEEVVQEAFLRAWGAIGRFDGRWRFSTWLYTIARREAVDVVRARARRAGGDEGVKPAAVAPPPARPDGEPGPGVWDVASEVLGREEFEALWLRYVEDRTPREIAMITGRSAVAVRVRLHRARERVRERLGEGRAER